jgi:hypothetical protein
MFMRTKNLIAVCGTVAALTAAAPCLAQDRQPIRPTWPHATDYARDPIDTDSVDTP